MRCEPVCSHTNTNTTLSLFLIPHGLLPRRTGLTGLSVTRPACPAAVLYLTLQVPPDLSGHISAPAAVAVATTAAAAGPRLLVPRQVERSLSQRCGRVGGGASGLFTLQSSAPRSSPPGSYASKTYRLAGLRKQHPPI